MDIADAVTDEYVARGPSTPLSEIRGASGVEPDARVVVIEDQDGFHGVVPQTQLLTSHHPPEETASSAMRSPPRVSRTEDVREVARLMVESELKLLPVFEGDEFVGVVTARDLVRQAEKRVRALASTRSTVQIAPGRGHSCPRERPSFRSRLVTRWPRAHRLAWFAYRQSSRSGGG